MQTKKKLTFKQQLEKELSELHKEYKQKREVVIERFDIMKTIGNFHVYVTRHRNKIHLNFNYHTIECLRKDYDQPNKNLLNKLLDLYYPLDMFLYRNGNIVGFCTEDELVNKQNSIIEQVYPIIIRKDSSNNILKIQWHSEKYHQIEVEFPIHKTKFLDLLQVPSSGYGMNSINYNSGYKTLYWPLQSEFDISQFIKD
jgi:hypothetical protein